MTHDTRWLDSGDAPEELLTLLRGAERARPLPAAVHARSRRRVAALGTVPMAAGTLLWLQHVALGAVAGTVVSVAVAVAPQLLAARTAPARPEQAAQGASSVRRVPHEEVRAASSAAAAATPVAAGSFGAAATGAVRASPISTEASVRPAAKERGGDLGAEARLLERARGLVTRDPEGALSVLHEHETEFRGGALELEREFLAIGALARLGRRSEATARAARVQALAPGSLYARRIEEELAVPAETRRAP